MGRDVRYMKGSTVAFWIQDVRGKRSFTREKDQNRMQGGESCQPTLNLKEV